MLLVHCNDIRKEDWKEDCLQYGVQSAQHPHYHEYNKNWVYKKENHTRVDVATASCDVPVDTECVPAPGDGDVIAAAVGSNIANRPKAIGLALRACRSVHKECDKKWKPENDVPRGFSKESYAWLVEELWARLKSAELKF